MGTPLAISPWGPMFPAGLLPLAQGILGDNAVLFPPDRQDPCGFYP